jgi:hypothetical protein
MGGWSYLEIFVPWHLVVCILAGAIDSGSMLLQRRHGRVILIGAGPLAVLHLDEAACRGKGVNLDGRHQYWCGGAMNAVL